MEESTVSNRTLPIKANLQKERLFRSGVPFKHKKEDGVFHLVTHEPNLSKLFAVRRDNEVYANVDNIGGLGFWCYSYLFGKLNTVKVFWEDIEFLPSEEIDIPLQKRLT